MAEEEIKIVQAAREKHGIIAVQRLPSGQLLIFRAPSKKEFEDFGDVDGKPRSVRQRQIVQQCCVHPRTEDAANPVEELKALLKEHFGLRTAASRAIAELAGNFVEFEKAEKFDPDQIAHLVEDGAKLFAETPAGELIGVKSPTERQYTEWQDGKDENKHDVFAAEVLVGPKQVLKQHVALLNAVLGAASELCGAMLDFEIKKG
jgi:hypothetical protein